MANADTKKQATVLCSSSHSIVLHSGEVLSPGDTLDTVDMDLATNRALMFDGHLTVITGFTPRTRQLASDTVDDELVVVVPQTQDTESTS